MSKLKKRIRLLSLIIFILIIVLSGALWIVTTPEKYPYPESVELGALDQKINQEFEKTTIECEDDYEGRVVATLLSKQMPDSLDQKKAVLYIHGYGDYFFQYHLADFYLGEGYNFYALDLRKHGRSWLPHQRPCFMKSIDEFYEEINKALQKIKDAGNDFILLNGHSAGGLVSALYADEGGKKDLIDALLLNSPFLNWPFDPAMETGIYAMAAFGRLRPYGQAPTGSDPMYGHTIHADHYGEWDYTTAWKPFSGFPKYLGWANAICEGQDKVAKGLTIDVPVLVLHSDESYTQAELTEAAMTSDAILNVEDIKKLAPHLGENIELAEIKNAMHDVFLSKKEVREMVFDKVREWLEGI